MRFQKKKNLVYTLLLPFNIILCLWIAYTLNVEGDKTRFLNYNSYFVQSTYLKTRKYKQATPRTSVHYVLLLM